MLKHLNLRKTKLQRRIEWLELSESQKFEKIEEARNDLLVARLLMISFEVTANEIYYQVKTVVDYSGNYTLFAIKKEDYEMFDSLLKLSNQRIQEFRAETFEKGYREGKYKADKLLRELRQMTFLQRLKWLFTN